MWYLLSWYDLALDLLRPAYLNLNLFSIIVFLLFDNLAVYFLKLTNLPIRHPSLSVLHLHHRIPIILKTKTRTPAILQPSMYPRMHGIFVMFRQYWKWKVVIIRLLLLYSYVYKTGYCVDCWCYRFDTWVLLLLL